jgi:hypothetical protein
MGRKSCDKPEKRAQAAAAARQYASAFHRAGRQGSQGATYAVAHQGRTDTLNHSQPTNVQKIPELVAKPYKQLRDLLGQKPDVLIGHLQEFNAVVRRKASPGYNPEPKQGRPPYVPKEARKRLKHAIAVLQTNIHAGNSLNPEERKQFGGILLHLCSQYFALNAASTSDADVYKTLEDHSIDLMSMCDDDSYYSSQYHAVYGDLSENAVLLVDIRRFYTPGALISIATGKMAEIQGDGELMLVQLPDTVRKNFPLTDKDDKKGAKWSKNARIMEAALFALMFEALPVWLKDKKHAPGEMDERKKCVAICALVAVFWRSFFLPKDPQEAAIAVFLHGRNEELVGALDNVIDLIAQTMEEVCYDKKTPLQEEANEDDTPIDDPDHTALVQAIYNAIKQADASGDEYRDMAAFYVTNGPIDVTDIKDEHVKAIFDHMKGTQRCIRVWQNAVVASYDTGEKPPEISVIDLQGNPLDHELAWKEWWKLLHMQLRHLYDNDPCGYAMRVIDFEFIDYVTQAYAVTDENLDEVNRLIGTFLELELTNSAVHSKLGPLSASLGHQNSLFNLAQKFRYSTMEWCQGETATNNPNDPINRLNLLVHIATVIYEREKVIGKKKVIMIELPKDMNDAALDTFLLKLLEFDVNKLKAKSEEPTDAERQEVEGMRDDARRVLGELNELKKFEPIGIIKGGSKEIKEELPCQTQVAAAVFFFLMVSEFSAIFPKGAIFASVYDHLQLGREEDDETNQVTPCGGYDFMAWLQTMVAHAIRKCTPDELEAMRNLGSEHRKTVDDCMNDPVLREIEEQARGTGGQNKPLALQWEAGATLYLGYGGQVSDDDEDASMSGDEEFEPPTASAVQKNEEDEDAADMSMSDEENDGEDGVEEDDVVEGDWTSQFNALKEDLSDLLSTLIKQQVENDNALQKLQHKKESQNAGILAIVPANATDGANAIMQKRPSYPPRTTRSGGRYVDRNADNVPASMDVDGVDGVEGLQGIPTIRQLHKLNDELTKFIEHTNACEYATANAQAIPHEEHPRYRHPIAVLPAPLSEHQLSENALIALSEYDRSKTQSLQKPEGSHIYKCQYGYNDKELDLREETVANFKKLVFQVGTKRLKSIRDRLDLVCTQVRNTPDSEMKQHLELATIYSDLDPNDECADFDLNKDDKRQRRNAAAENMMAATRELTSFERGAVRRSNIKIAPDSQLKGGGFNALEIVTNSSNT